MTNHCSRWTFDTYSNYDWTFYDLLRMASYRYLTSVYLSVYVTGKLLIAPSSPWANLCAVRFRCTKHIVLHTVYVVTIIIIVIIILIYTLEAEQTKSSRDRSVTRTEVGHHRFSTGSSRYVYYIRMYRNLLLLVITTTRFLIYSKHTHARTASLVSPRWPLLGYLLKP